MFLARAETASIADSSLNVIPRKSLKDTAVQRICEAIESGELESGAPLTELGLAKKLGVAQPTIREALLELEFSGFIESAGPRRKRVTLLTREAIDDIYLVRGRLEILAVELVAAQKSPDLLLCWKQVEQMEAAAAKETLTAFWHADLAFHRALWRSSNSANLQSSLERLVPKLFAFAIIRHGSPSSHQRLEIARTHRRLLELLTAGEAEAARRLMEISMETARLDDYRLIG